jgi:hypothetical protein
MMLALLDRIFHVPFDDLDRRAMDVKARRPRPQRSGNDTGCVVPVTTDPAFTFGTPRELFRGRFEIDRPPRSYDVTGDGERFFFMTLPRGGKQRLAPGSSPARAGGSS